MLQSSTWDPRLWYQWSYCAIGGEASHWRQPFRPISRRNFGILHHTAIAFYQPQWDEEKWWDSSWIPIPRLGGLEATFIIQKLLGWRKSAPWTYTLIKYPWDLRWDSRKDRNWKIHLPEVEIWSQLWDRPILPYCILRCSEKWILAEESKT